MNPILIFSLFFNVTCTVVMVMYSWKIMRLEVTPTWTWSLKFLACIIQLFQIGMSVFYIYDISTFLSSYPPETLIISYSIGAIRSALLMIFVVRVYTTLIVKFPLAK